MKSIILAILAAFQLLLYLYGSNEVQSTSQPENNHSFQFAIHREYAELYDNTIKSMSFSNYTQYYFKHYSSEEQKRYRQQIFIRNIIQIHQHNLLYESGVSTFFKGINSFSDITDQQWIEKYAWKHKVDLETTNECKGSIIDSPSPLPQFQWGNKVSSVDNQGECGKDWAMVSAYTVESLYALKVGTLPSLSVQQLVDCSGAYGNEGCNGGYMEQAYWYIIDNGIATTKSYPTTAKALPCRYILNMKYTSFKQCARVPTGIYSKLLSAIIQQPVAVSVNIAPDMKSFKGGVYNGECTSELNHAMLLTGYGGKEVSTYFWKVKNTLGKDWGTNGYLNIKRQEKDGDGKCGIQILASVPQILV